MEQFRRQETVPLQAKAYTSGTLTDADSTVVEVKDPGGVIVVDSQSMGDSVSDGVYVYNYTSAATAAPGKYHANAILTTGTVVVRPETWFEIVEEVE